MAKITREIFEIIKLINTVEYQNTRSDNTLLNIISKKIKNIHKNNKYKDDEKSIERKDNSIYELTCLDDYICDEEGINNSFTDFIRNISLLADAANNMAHSSKFSDITDAFYSLKSNIINVIHKEVKKNKKEIDIIEGFKEDTINGEKVKSYVIDIPGNGQLSWHLKKNVPSELQEDYDKKYPYGIAKNDEFYNHNLLLSLLSEKNLTDHDYLVAYNEEGTENQLREILDVYYSNNYLMESDENRDKKCDAIGKKTNLSKANIDNLTKVLRVSKEKVYEYREQYIQEESIEREKRGNK